MPTWVLRAGRFRCSASKAPHRTTLGIYARDENGTCGFKPLVDSYTNAGFARASLTEFSHLLVGVPSTIDPSTCTGTDASARNGAPATDATTAGRRPRLARFVEAKPGRERSQRGRSVPPGGRTLRRRRRAPANEPHRGRTSKEPPWRRGGDALLLYPGRGTLSPA
jgi:hypothetical protein